MRAGLPFTVFCLALVACVQAGQKIDPTELKCLVCEKTLEEVQVLLSKVDPDLKVDAGGYRLDSDGNVNRKQVSQATSEIYLSELLEEVCGKMDDYVRATWKTSGGLTLIKLIEDGKMTPLMDKVDIIQDGDLNKSLKYYCETLVEELEDVIVKNLAEGADNIDIKVCSIAAGYCDKRLPQSEL